MIMDASKFRICRVAGCLASQKEQVLPFYSKDSTLTEVSLLDVDLCFVLSVPLTDGKRPKCTIKRYTKKSLEIARICAHIQTFGWS